VFGVVGDFFGKGRRNGDAPAGDTVDGVGARVGVLFQPVGQHGEPAFVVGVVEAGGGQRVEGGHGRGDGKTQAPSPFGQGGARARPGRARGVNPRRLSRRRAPRRRA